MSSFQMRFFPVVVLAAVCLGLTDRVAAQVIDSTFIETFGTWTDVANWYPAEVPNNAGAKTFNVSMRYLALVSLDQDKTISNLTLEGDIVLRVIGGTLRMLETTTNGARIGVDDEDDHGIKLEGGANVFAGALTSFSSGTLSGAYRLFGGSANRSTLLQFDGADIEKLSGALVGLEGPFARIVDENGLDALRNLREIGPGSRFNVNDRQFTTAGDFTNNGTLNLGQLHAGDGSGFTSFTVSGTLTNFDGATNTLNGGSFRLGSPGAGADSVLRFPNANIVNNAATIYIEGAACRIVDQNGNDALRHFAHNLANGIFETLQGFSTEGDFANDGTLKLRVLPFKVTGKLTNFAPDTKTLTGGTYSVAQKALEFAGADIVHNAASLVLGHPPTIVDENGADGLRNLADNQANGSISIKSTAELTLAGDFTNLGSVTIQQDDGFTHGVISVPPGFRYVQLSGETVVDGTLVAENISIEGGVLRGAAGWLWGDVAVGDATFAPTGQRTEVIGNLALSPQSHFRASIGSDYTQLYVNGGSTVIAGTIEAEVPDGFRPARSSVYLVIDSEAVISGVFKNVASGGRLLTTDGKGSFLVTYDQHSVWFSDYEPVPPPAQLLNISTRAQVLTGDNLVIAGFIVPGSVPKKIAVRGMGPSLEQLGVTGALQNPTINVLDQNATVVATNDDWRTSQQSEIMQTGLAPADNREAALITTLDPGSYTVALRGVNQTTGVGVVELYDLAATNSSKLANISTRAHIGTGGNVLIGGFIAGGDSANVEVVVRAIGPDLQAYGVPGSLPDPTLELRDANGELKAANDDFYQASPEIDWAFRPSDARDSVIRTNVPPGNYTAIVRGKDGAQGVALVEIYDLNGQ